MPITGATSDQFLFNVMPECAVSVSRKGVVKDELLYRNNDPDLMVMMYSLGNKHEKLTVRYDPRDAGNLYYLKDGHIEKLWLNTEIPSQEEFLGMTWAEVGNYMKAKKKLKKAGEEIALDVRSFRRQTYDQIVSISAAKVCRIPKSMEVRKNRAVEKQRVNFENRIAARMEQYQEPESLPALVNDQIPLPDEPVSLPPCAVTDPMNAGALMLDMD